ncbi:hypothetical protein DJ564_06605 [Pseudomonas sp. 31-12]|nr:hypothetical protein DJ564_06605 [Pseudomonas sp. 31-12]
MCSGIPDLLKAWGTQFLKGVRRSMWERVCSRLRLNIQHFCWLTHRYREQARSHRYWGKSVFLLVVTG